LGFGERGKGRINLVINFWYRKFGEIFQNTRKLVDFTLGKQKNKINYTRTWDPLCFPGYLSHGTDLFTYLPPLHIVCEGHRYPLVNFLNLKSCKCHNFFEKKTKFYFLKNWLLQSLRKAKLNTTKTHPSSNFP